MEFDFWNVAGLLVLGAVSGVLAGLLGIGGGVIQVPALALLFGVCNPLLIKGIGYLTILLTVISSSVKHFRSGLVIKSVAFRLAPLAAAGIILGYAASREMPITAFQGAFGAFLLYVTAQNLYKFFRPGADPGRNWSEEDARGREWKAWLIGGPMGFIAGLLGIGGGSVAVPSLQVLAGLPLRNAIACSSVTMIPIAAVATALSMYDGCRGRFGCPVWVAVVVCLLMAPGSVAGAWVGAWLTKVLPVRLISLVFGLTLLATGLKMLHAAFS